MNSCFDMEEMLHGMRAKAHLTLVGCYLIAIDKSITELK